MGTWFKRGFKFYGPEMILDVLEERIVLDASVAPNADNHDANAGSTTPIADVPTPSNAAESSAGAASSTQSDSVHDAQAQVFSQKLDVVLVSSDVSALEVASVKVADGAKVIVYDAATDNLATITAALDNVVQSAGQQIGTLAIVDHGADGLITIGTDHITSANMFKFSAAFDALGKDLAPDAQIEFFGCSIAQSADGQALIDQVASSTDSVVFASTDVTGGTSSDWTLEYSSDPGAVVVPLLTVGSAIGPELIFSGYVPLDNLSNPDCHQYFSALDSLDVRASNSGTGLTTQYAEIWTFHLDVATDVIIGMQTCHPDLTHSQAGGVSNNLFIDCWLDLYSGTTTAGTRIAFNDDWVGPGTNQVPDWSGNDALLAGGASLHLAPGDYCIQATSWNDGTYDYMNGGYYLLSNIPLNTPTTGHYVAPPTVGDIPDQQRPENFGTYNYDVHSYFVDTPGGGLVYQLGSTIYMDGLTLDALSLNAGSGVITFRSDYNVAGEVLVQVRAHDGELYTPYEPFLFTVQPDFDLPTADSQNVTITYGSGTTTIRVYGHDIDGDASAGVFAVVPNYSTIHGDLEASGGTVDDGDGTYHQDFLYTPDAGYWGPDGFQFTFSVLGGSWKGFANTGVNIGITSDTDSYDVALVDLGNDGTMDLVAAKPYVAPTTTNAGVASNFYVNNGYGFFVNGVSLQYPSTTSAGNGVEVATGDLNGDGFADVVVRNGTAGGTSNQPDVVYLWNNTTQSFTLAQQLARAGTENTGSITLGDFNGDGRLDIARVHNSTGEIFLNNGDGTFPTAASSTLPNMWTTYAVVEAGDFNGDGATDLFVGSSGEDQRHYIFYNDTHGNFVNTRSISNTGRGYATDCAVGDVDHDGRLDIVVSRGTTDDGYSNIYYRNTGTGGSGYTTWAASTITNDADYTTDIALADVDGNGYLDVLTATYGEPVKLYPFHASTGRFDLAETNISGDLNALSITTGDVNGNGTVDVIVGLADGRSQIFYNKGFNDADGYGDILLHADPATVTIQVEPITNWGFENAYSGWTLSETYQMPTPYPSYVTELGTFGVLSSKLSPWDPLSSDPLKNQPPVVHDYYDGNDQMQYSPHLLDAKYYSGWGMTVPGSTTDHTAVILSGGLRDATLTHDPVTITQYTSDPNIQFLELSWDLAYWNTDPGQADGAKFTGTQFVSVTLYDADNPSTCTTWTTTNANSPTTGKVSSMQHFSIEVPATNPLVTMLRGSGTHHIGVKIEVCGLDWYLDVAVDDFKLIPYRQGPFGDDNLGAPDLMMSEALVTGPVITALDTGTTTASFVPDSSLATVNLSSSATESLLRTLQSAPMSLTPLFVDPMPSTSSIPAHASYLADATTVSEMSVDPSPTGFTPSAATTTPVQPVATGDSGPASTDIFALVDRASETSTQPDESHIFADLPGLPSDASADISAVSANLVVSLGQEYDPRLALILDLSDVSALDVLQAQAQGLGLQVTANFDELGARLAAGESVAFDMDSIRLAEI